jgi:hypothetical protein
VIVSLLYKLTRTLLSLPAAVPRRDYARDTELLMPRHEKAILRRHINGRVRYEPGDGYCRLVFHKNGAPDGPELAVEPRRRGSRIRLCHRGGCGVVTWATETDYEQLWPLCADGMSSLAAIWTSVDSVKRAESILPPLTATIG